MQKIKIRLPATATNLGPGIESLGLALRLYVTVEVSARRDTQVNVHIKGQGETGLAHPVVRAMSRFFQYMEQAVLGFDIPSATTSRRAAAWERMVRWHSRV